MFDVLMCQSIDGKEAWQQRQSDEKKKKKDLLCLCENKDSAIF